MGASRRPVGSGVATLARMAEVSLRFPVRESGELSDPWDAQNNGQWLQWNLHSLLAGPRVAGSAAERSSASSAVFS